MLFTGVNRGKPVSSIGFYSRSRRMGNRGSGNANRTEAGITHRENLRRDYSQERLMLLLPLMSLLLFQLQGGDAVLSARIQHLLHVVLTTDDEKQEAAAEA